MPRHLSAATVFAASLCCIFSAQLTAQQRYRNFEAPAATAIAASGGFGSPRIGEQKRFAFTLSPHSWHVLKLQ